MRGARIGITGDRRAAEQAALVRALGGVPVMAPALAADQPGDEGRLLAELDAALASPPDEVVFLTGAGAGMVLDAADRHGRGPALRAALAGARVIARGPKPRAALRARGVRIDRVIDPPRAAVVLEALMARAGPGRRVLIQGFGPPPEAISGPLRAAGAQVLELSPYAAGWPADPRPAQRLAREAAAGAVAAISFTSAVAASQFAALAESAGVSAQELTRGGALIAAVGPVTRAALEAAGLAVDVEPERQRMGSLYRALAQALAARALSPSACPPRSR